MSEMRDFEIFLAATRCGSFTEAAASMRLSVAAVSRAIARLELHMDCRMFNRTTRRLNLTAEGRLALLEVTAGMERLRNARALLHEQRGRASGNLKVLLPNAFAKHYMMPELPAFLDRHPDLELDMHVEDFRTDLLAGGFELAVQHGPVPANGYISRSLGAMKVVLVASPAYLAKHGVPRSIEDLDKHRRVQLRSTDGTTYSWHLQHSDGRAVNIHRPAGQCFINSHLDAVISCAVWGVGIALSDIGAIRQHLLNGELRIVLPDYAITNETEVVMLYPHRDHVSLKARVFMDFVIDIARRKISSSDIDCHAFAA